MRPGLAGRGFDKGGSEPVAAASRAAAEAKPWPPCRNIVLVAPRCPHRHPMYSAGGHQAHRLVVITEADGTFVVTQFDRDNDL